jgi:hypothetical protein
VSDRSAFVVMVTDGTVLEYAPEIYVREARARQEAERWAWILAGGGWIEIDSPFDGRWEVAGRDVRLVEVPWVAPEGPTPWVATYWTEDGYPDPEAHVIWSRELARSWVSTGPDGTGPVELLEEPWMLAATFRRGDEEAYAVAHLAKVVVDL